MPKESSRKSFKKGKTNRELERRAGNKEPRKYLLIVVEGQETEYNYFCSLRRDLRLRTTKVEVISASGGDPLVIVEKAYDLVLEKKQESARGGEPEYDEVFCVFDQDNKPKKYDEALKQAEKYGVIPITSIPCFEFWFLLHYCCTDSPFDKCKDVINRLKQVGLTNYEKNVEVYSLLKPKLVQALANAEHIEKQHKNSNGYANPSTKVHILVKQLQKQKDFE